MSAARWRPWAPRAALVVPVLVLALAGCGTKNGGADDGVASAVNTGSGKGTTTTTKPVDDETAMIAYSKCLREHGIDVDDASAGVNSKAGAQAGRSSKGGAGIRVQGGDKKKLDAANTACQKYAPNGGQPPKLDAKQLESIRKMAACMRSHGVPSFPDPKKDGQLEIEYIKGKSDPSLDPEGKTFQKATEACRGDDVPMMMKRSDGGSGGGAGPKLDSSGGGQ